jgi:Ca2+-binding RTX toxin-like protein
LLGGIDAKVAEDTDYYVYYGDELDGGPGDDVLEGGRDRRHDGTVDRITYAQAPAPVVVDLTSGSVTGDGTDTVVGGIGAVVGGPFDDVMTGTDGPDVLYGGPGSDHLSGGRGDDELTAGGRLEEEPETAPNTMLGGPGRDSIFGGEGDDLAHGGSGNDFLQMEGGADRSYGGAGTDSVNDAILPAAGQVVDGGPGSGDTLTELTLLDSRGSYRGGATGRMDLGRERLRAWLGQLVWDIPLSGFEDVSTPTGRLWTVIGSDRGERILAGTLHHPVRIFAKGGNDEIFGSDADDVLNGGPGFDRGTGWGGHDRIVSVERVLGGR